MKTNKIILLAITCCGCSHSHSDGGNSTYQDVAQAYYRLGVSDANLIISQHLSNNEPIPTAQILLSECKEYDLKHGGDKDTFLHTKKD